METISRYVAPDERIEGLHPGDLLLTHGDDFLNRFVQLGQQLRMALARIDTRPQRREWCHYDHVAVYIGKRVPKQLGAAEPVDMLVEALPGLVRYTPLSRYDGREYHVVDVSSCVAPGCPGSAADAVDERDREQMVRYLEACVGLRYGMFWHYLGMTLTTLMGGTVTLSGAQQEICSSMAAQATVRGDHIFDRPPPCVMPADLARHFGVRPMATTGT